MKKTELLAPAGSFEKAKVAFEYGADAIYCGTSKLSLRSRVDIDDNGLEKIIEYAHSINKKVYVPLNIYARDEMYDDVRKQIEMLRDIKADGVIVSEGGVLEEVKDKLSESSSWRAKYPMVNITTDARIDRTDKVLKVLTLLFSWLAFSSIEWFS